MSDIATQILQDYPSFAFLLNDPEIGPLLLDAVDPNKGFDAATFQAKLLQTNWWKNSSIAQRSWETLAATDPAEAAARKATWIAQVHNLASQNGVNLQTAQLDNWADFYMSQGITANDPRIINSIVNLYEAEPAFRTPQGGGNIASTGDQVKQLADQYMVDLPSTGVGSLTDWTARIARGESTVQGLQADLTQMAAERYGYYADRINAGSTPASLFADKRQAIATQLEVSPDSIDLLHDPRWSQVLGVPDGKGGTQPMTYSQAIVLARSQPEWGKTTVARQQGADLTEQLLKTFGKVA